MKELTGYSDEHISAYIDGELDSEERARLLFDEQTDRELAQRINDARMLKETVHLIYSDIKNPRDEKRSFSCTESASPYRAIVASLVILSVITYLLIFNTSNIDNLTLAKQLISNTPPIEAGFIRTAIADHDRIIINVSQYQPLTFSETINHIEVLLHEHSSDKPFKIEIVANEQGLKVLDTETSLHAESISLLASQYSNLEVVACAKSLAQLATDGDPIQLMKSILITASAAEHVAMRLNEGWLYLKI